jgi:hypothetical protein
VWRRLALQLAFLVTETLGFFVIAAVLAGTVNRSAAAYPAFFAAEAGGFFLVRALLRFEFSSRTLVMVGALVSVVALVTLAGLAAAPTVFPPGWSGVGSFVASPGDTLGRATAPVIYDTILFVVAWARGVQVAQERLERDRALRSFSFGLVVLVLGLLFSEDSTAKGAVNGASLPLVGFGLLTLTLIHLRDARPGEGDSLRGPWTFIAAGTVLALVVVGFALGTFPLGPAGWLYDHAVAPVLTLAVDALAWVLVAFAFPFAWVLSELFKLFFHPGQLQQDQNALNLTNNLVQQQNKKHSAGPPAVAILLAKGLVVLLAVAVIAFLAYRLFRRLHRPLEDDEDREALQGEGSLLGDLAALWRSLRPRRPAFWRPPEPDLPPRAREVRRLYLRLLEAAQARGKPRPASATPSEFEPALEAAVAPTAAQQTTEAFVRARYGLVEPSEQELAHLRDAIREAT